MMMNRFVSVFSTIVLLVVQLCAAQEVQQPATTSPQTAVSSPAPIVQTPKAAPTKPTLEDGTPVKLRISQTVSSADAQVGQTVNFEVLEEVKVGETLVIPKGGVAWATVTEAQSKRRMGRGGKLNVNIDTVRLVDGEKVALRAVKDAKGGGHVGAMTGAIVATSIVFFPAAPLFLFMHGKDITIPKGTEITAFINGDAPLDLAKFQPQSPTPIVGTNTTSAATLDFSSNPAGAEIDIDGNYAGNTPSSMSVAAGEHAIKISKPGFKTWERKLKINAGNIKVGAELEPNTATTDAPQAK
jgi:hypothetical protein